MKSFAMIITSLFFALSESGSLGNYELPSSGQLINQGSSPSIASVPSNLLSSGHTSAGPTVYIGQHNAPTCGDGQVLHVDGNCVTSNIYIFDIPNQPIIAGPSPQIPLPKVEHNIIFVRIPENDGGQEPIVAIPPQQKNIVYILNKKTAAGQNVVHIPAPARQKPEVYFVNYGQGQNPTLPGGFDLQTALDSAVDLGNNPPEAFGQNVGGPISGMGAGGPSSGMGAGGNVRTFRIPTIGKLSGCSSKNPSCHAMM